MGDKLKVGVVGVGSLGQHHARVYSEMDQAELVGVFDADKDRARQIADTCGARAYDDLQELSKQIEAASIAVPTDEHFRVSSMMMEHDVHLLVEKPIASTTSDAETMVRAAETRNLILQVGHVERFNPVMKYLEDTLIDPRFIEATRLAEYPAPRPGAPPRGTEVSVVLDLMIHDLEIILHLVKSPLKEMHAVGVPVLSPGEDIANARLCFENGAVANITASRISRERLRKIRVFEQNAYVSLDYQNQSGEVYRKTPAGIVPEAVPIEKGDALTIELSAFVNCVTHRNEPIVSGRHASTALRLAVDICEHIREGGS